MDDYMKQENEDFGSIATYRLTFIIAWLENTCTSSRGCLGKASKE